MQARLQCRAAQPQARLAAPTSAVRVPWAASLRPAQGLLPTHRAAAAARRQPLSIVARSRHSCQVAVPVGEEGIDVALKKFRTAVSAGGIIYETRRRKRFEDSTDKKKRKLRELQLKRKSEKKWPSRTYDQVRGMDVQALPILTSPFEDVFVLGPLPLVEEEEGGRKGWHRRQRQSGGREGESPPRSFGGNPAAGAGPAAEAAATNGGAQGAAYVPPAVAAQRAEQAAQPTGTEQPLMRPGGLQEPSLVRAVAAPRVSWAEGGGAPPAAPRAQRGAGRQQRQQQAAAASGGASGDAGRQRQQQQQQQPVVTATNRQQRQQGESAAAGQS